jgi:hypothetical protein
MRVVCELEQDLVRQSAGRHEDANEYANSRTHTLPSEGAPEGRYCLPDQASVIVEQSWSGTYIREVNGRPSASFFVKGPGEC